jgi:hypothetical protein
MRRAGLARVARVARPVPAALTAALALHAAPARAADVGSAAGAPLQLDVTETTVVSQRFDARGAELFQDSGWGQWENRLNAALRWERWTAGLRLDSFVYWRRPVDNPGFAGLPASTQQGVLVDNESRYLSSIYPAKLWVTYAAPGLEVTAGDAYVQFGHGLTLSMRKIDELGVDTTLRGVKVQWTADPVQLTLVAGFGNPSRVDESSGRALFPTHAPVAGDVVAPVFGSDRIVGAELQEGRGLPVVLTTRGVQITRCAPYAYGAGGAIVTDPRVDPAGVTFGTCDAADVQTWLSSLQGQLPVASAREITMAGQSLEVPTLGGHGKLYLEAAVQQTRHDLAAQDAHPDGNAVYGAMDFDAGPTVTTLELKSNRNFYAVPASVNTTVAPELSVVTYTFLPPAETFSMIDTEFNSFDACVDGARAREDVDVTRGLMLYAQGIYARTRSEQLAGGCDAMGRTVSALPAAQIEDHVYDGVTGLEAYFDGNRSHLYVSSGARSDVKASGAWFYTEAHAEYALAKILGGPWSLEVTGRHRMRREENQNDDPTTLVERWWNEGENYVALKHAPDWVITQGFEYTTLAGQPLTYVNGSVLYKPTGASNVRLFVGQQRGAFRCASGVCRFFPAFEGARLEVTVRF